MFVVIGERHAHPSGVQCSIPNAANIAPLQGAEDSSARLLQTLRPYGVLFANVQTQSPRRGGEPPSWLKVFINGQKPPSPYWVAMFYSERGEHRPPTGC